MTNSVEGLPAGVSKVITIEVAPTSLNHADSLVAEIRQHATQELRFGNKIRVKDGDVLTGGMTETITQGAGLIAFARVAMQVSGIDAFPPHLLHRAARDIAGLVSRIVQNLDLQTVTRIVEQPDGIQQAPYNIALVEDRQLYRDAGPFGRIRRAHGRLVAVAEI
jgi:hypothetical protein